MQQTASAHEALSTGAVMICEKFGGCLLIMMMTTMVCENFDNDRRVVNVFFLLREMTTIARYHGEKAAGLGGYILCAVHGNRIILSC